LITTSCKSNRGENHHHNNKTTTRCLLAFTAIARATRTPKDHNTHNNQRPTTGDCSAAGQSISAAGSKQQEIKATSMRLPAAASPSCTTITATPGKTNSFVEDGSLQDLPRGRPRRPPHLSQSQQSSQTNAGPLDAGSTPQLIPSHVLPSDRHNIPQSSSSATLRHISRS